MDGFRFDVGINAWPRDLGLSPAIDPVNFPFGDAWRCLGEAVEREKLMIHRAFLFTLLALAGGFWTGVARGAAYNFADFTDLSGTRPFSFTNNSTSATIATSVGTSSSIPVTFDFTTPTGLSTAPRAAMLTITGSTSTPASNPGGNVDQPITTATLSITENSTGKNLLSMTFTGILAGIASSPNAQLSGADTNSQTVTFTSDYLTFTPPGNSYALSLAAVTPALSIGPGSFLGSFQADITGQFTGNAVPEPVSMGLLALAPLALLRRR
jgi:hypothetical protein